MSRLDAFRRSSERPIARSALRCLAVRGCRRQFLAGRDFTYLRSADVAAAGWQDLTAPSLRRTQFDAWTF